MERAKRLELRSTNLEEFDPNSVGNFSKATDSQLSTHATELAKVVAAWPHLAKEIWTTILTLMRFAKSDNDGQRH